MNILKGIITEYGFPILDEVIVANPANNTGVKLKALLDTGAGEFHLKQSAIDLLKLQRIENTHTIHPIHGNVLSPIFHAQLAIQGIELGIIKVKPIIGDFPIDFIVGCGLFKDWVINYNGKNKTIIISI